MINLNFFKLYQEVILIIFIIKKWIIFISIIIFLEENNFEDLNLSINYYINLCSLFHVNSLYA